ncbi:MAG: preprotein translocase subunit SecA [Oscillospiraceae bacterium]|nr:preprotein translocase subunit SecA [Oscillospiraceae bacterium]
MGLFKSLFGTYSSKELKRIEPIKNAVLALEDKYSAMSEQELKAQTGILKDRLAAGETLDDILPDAFAVCREASTRVIGIRHYPVQIIGGIVLHQGRIAEMKTGEGKTFVAALPSYLNGLTGKGVHIVTVNDYLAKRDSELMAKVHRYLGLTVGLISHDMDNDERRAAYACDITYATNNELGFDYLRDNMCMYKKDKVQRAPNFAIVDEVDSILIDEARTPLIISGRGDKSTDLYEKADKFAKTLTMNKVAELDDKEDYEGNFDGDYLIDEKAKTCNLLPNGVAKAEKWFGVENLMDPENTTLLHHINQAIRANGIMKLDIDYVIKDGEIVIVDEFTGRLMFGRRYNDGLHQAIEAKEGVKVNRESKTLATITFQNFFRLYDKLSGMTGTAMTEESEFREIYSLDVIEIPTNKSVIRIDNHDQIYKNERGKFKAVCDQVEECHKKGQPVLVGTVTIEKSELVSKLLKARGIKHQVLNAKNHEREAEIVAQAGKKGAVTIATNMAGRGTDIKLGGNAEYLAIHEMRKLEYSEELIQEATGFAETDNEEILEARAKYQELNKKFETQIKPEAEEVRAAGGLFIIGTERHESRRIDNQLRGRSGRQGDPGESRFYISLEDDLMRLFGGDRVQKFMESMNFEEDQPIEASFLSSAIESAQKKIEGRNFSIRKNVLDFDDVMSQQRMTIYTQRNKVLDGEDVSKNIIDMMNTSIDETVDMYCSDTVAENWNLDGLRSHFLNLYVMDTDLHYTTEELNELDKKDISDFLKKRGMLIYKTREADMGAETMREVERVCLLKTVDRHWMDHIDAMEELKRGIYLRSYGQKDPVVEYRFEGFAMFDEMIAAIREETVRMVLTVPVRVQRPPQREQVMKPDAPNAGAQTPYKNKGEKIGRNDPCPCGSGKKYKNCCGKDE